MLEKYKSQTNPYEQHWHTELLEMVAHGSHWSHGFFKCEGGMMRWKEYLDGNVFWKKKGILEGRKKGFSRENQWNFYAHKWIFMQNEGGNE